MRRALKRHLSALLKRPLPARPCRLVTSRGWLAPLVPRLDSCGSGESGGQLREAHSGPPAVKRPQISLSITLRPCHCVNSHAETARDGSGPTLVCGGGVGRFSDLLSGLSRLFDADGSSGAEKTVMFIQDGRSFRCLVLER